MKKFIILVLFLCVSCKEYRQPNQTITKNDKCFDIINIKNEATLSPILLNRCTGETYIVLLTPIVEGGKLRKYTWHKLERYEFNAAIQSSI